MRRAEQRGGAGPVPTDKLHWIGCDSMVEEEVSVVEGLSILWSTVELGSLVDAADSTELSKVI